MSQDTVKSTNLILTYRSEQPTDLTVLFLSFFYGAAHAAFACLTGWPNAQPQGLD